MHLERVTVQNFRNLENLEVSLRQGFNVLVGRNNTGKSNLFQAIRHALGPLASPGEALWLRREDLTKDQSGTPSIDQPIRISLQFAGLTKTEQAHFFEILDFNAASPEESKALVHFEAEWDEDRGRYRRYRRWGGRYDGERTEVPAMVLQSLPITFLPALRDATQALTPGRGSRLAHLLERLAETREAGPDEDTIQEIFAAANSQLEDHPLVRSSIGRLDARARTMAGTDYVPSRISASELGFRKVLQSLRILLGGPAEDLGDNGLGYNNLLFIATVLSQLREGEPGEMPILLIEEPEAHLHPQLTQRLALFFQEELGDQEPPQTLVATHSPTLVAGVSPSQVSVLFSQGNPPKARINSLADIGLQPESERALSRMLDITKASLFFAKGLILVEGVSEELLLPALARRAGVDLSEAHVSIIPLCGVSFQTLAAVLGPDGLGVPVSIVTDGDPEVVREGDTWKSDTPRRDGEGGFEPSQRVRSLRETFEGHETVRVFNSAVTLEHALAAAGAENPSFMTAIWEEGYPGGRTLTSAMVEDARDTDEKALVVWRGVCRSSHGWSKAEFAHALADAIDRQREDNFAVPPYIRGALEWVVPSDQVVSGAGESQDNG